MYSLSEGTVVIDCEEALHFLLFRAMEVVAVDT